MDRGMWSNNQEALQRFENTIFVTTGSKMVAETKSKITV
jgi:hypothetical protein